jgi:hypothetical protein
VIDGKFYERPTYPTGFVIDAAKGRTGNLLFRRKIVEDCEQVFRPEFVTGEDQDFFRRMIERGHRFIWCDEAVAYEVIPPARWSRKMILRRSFLRGKFCVIEPTFGFKEVVKSLFAVPIYSVALPFLMIFGQHWVMKYSDKLCYHAGKLLGALHLDPARERYVTE